MTFKVSDGALNSLDWIKKGRFLNYCVQSRLSHWYVPHHVVMMETEGLGIPDRTVNH